MPFSNWLQLMDMFIAKSCESNVFKKKKAGELKRKTVPRLGFEHVTCQITYNISALSLLPLRHVAASLNTGEIV